jgi:hypothetical protein
MASPQSAAGPWVRRELEWWKHGDRQRLFIVLMAGSIVWNPTIRDFDREVTDALPAELEDLRAHRRLVRLGPSSPAIYQL